MHFSTKKQFLASAIIMAFMMNVLLPFFAIYTIPAAQATDHQPTDERVLVCTTNGFKWVPLTAFYKDSPPHTPSKHYKCPLCFLSAHAIKHFPPVSMYDFAYLHTQIPITYFSHEPSSLKTRILALTRFSRAPPHTA